MSKEDSQIVLQPVQQPPQPAQLHVLSNSWTLWAHLPRVPDWSVSSYKYIAELTTVESAHAITELLSDALIKRCMFFLMREDIKPVWEDPKNRSGGCFTYKVPNKCVHETWKKITYFLVGNTLSDKPHVVQNINGITISPKKNFGVIKIWMATELYQNPEEIVSGIEGIIPAGCSFRKHSVE
jgi:hypothetical protein